MLPALRLSDARDQSKAKSGGSREGGADYREVVWRIQHSLKRILPSESEHVIRLKLRSVQIAVQRQRHLCVEAMPAHKLNTVRSPLPPMPVQN